MAPERPSESVNIDPPVGAGLDGEGGCTSNSFGISHRPTGWGFPQEPPAALLVQADQAHGWQGIAFSSRAEAEQDTTIIISV